MKVVDQSGRNGSGIQQLLSSDGQLTVHISKLLLGLFRLYALSVEM